MKVFISWSGIPSFKVALALRDWLPDIFQNIKPFVSSEDIRKGKRWPLEISSQLDSCNFGIVCLAPGNIDAPWVLFEAGALSKSINESAVYTLLLGGLRPGDIDGPLSHFQHTAFEKPDFFKLVCAINEAHGAEKQEALRLKRRFDKYWDELESAVGVAMKAQEHPMTKRNTHDILLELVETTKYIAQNIPQKGSQFQKHASVRSRDQADFWTTFTETVRKSSPFAGTYLAEAAGRMEGDALIIEFPTEFSDHVPLVNNQKNLNLFRSTLTNMGYPVGTEIEILPRPVK